MDELSSPAWIAGNQRLPAYNRATLAPVAPPGKKTAKSADEWLLNGSEWSESQDSNSNGGSDAGAAPEPRALSGEPIGEETAQWLVDPSGKLSPIEKVAPPEPKDDEPAAKPAAFAPSEDPAPPPKTENKRQPKGTTSGKGATDLEKENQDLAKRIRDLQTQLRIQEKDSKTKLAAALKERDANLEGRMRAAEDESKERIEQAKADLVKKHDSREERLTKTFEKREAELRARIEKLESELADAKKATEEKAAPAKRQKAERKATRTRRTARSTGALDLNEASFEELRNLSLSVTQSARLIAYRDVRGGFESLDELDEIPGLSSETRSDLRKRLTLSS